jgi:hypothetical protein
VLAAKKAARKVEEDEKNKTEDEEWGRNVLNDMINKLGTRKEVEKDIRDHRRKREFAQRLANFSYADEDGNPVMMTKNATRGFGPSSRDANYRENVRLMVGGGREKGFCAVPRFDHPKMELLHECAAPASDLFISSAPWPTIFLEEKMIASTALVIATQVSCFNLYCTLY